MPNFSFSGNTKHISMKGSKQYKIICKCGKHDSVCSSSIEKPPAVIYSVLQCVTGPQVDLNLDMEFSTYLTGIKQIVNLRGPPVSENNFFCNTKQNKKMYLVKFFFMVKRSLKTNPTAFLPVFLQCSML